MLNFTISCDLSDFYDKRQFMRQQSVSYIVLFLFFLFYKGIGLILANNLGKVNKPSYANMQSGVEILPVESRLGAYWWRLNGLVTKDLITRDFSAMNAKRYGGAIIFE